MVQAPVRPKGVTLVVVLILVSAAFDVLSVILQLLTREGANIALISVPVTAVIAIVYLLLAKGVADGREVARVIVAVASSISIVAAVWMMFTQPHLWWSLIVQVVLSLLVLGLLYTEQAREFFERRAS